MVETRLHLTFLTFYLLLMLALPPAVSKGAEENDFYRLISVVASQAPSESRSKNWKPAPDGLENLCRISLRHAPHGGL